MNEREPLDHELAERMRAAAEHEPYRVLDDAARERVVAALRTEAAKPKPQQGRPWLAAGALAAAAAVGLALWSRPEPIPPQHAAACGLPVDARLVQQGERRTIDLGRHGRIAVSADAQARISRAESCAFEVTLSRGTLAAELHDLRPARLDVRTPFGVVEVHGTTFSVDVEDTLEVALLEGRVELLEADQAPVQLAPGKALRRARASRAQVAPLREEQARALRTLLDPPVAPVATGAPAQVEEARVEKPRDTTSATELLVAAERARREGDLTEARVLYKQAAKASGPDVEVAMLRQARFELDNGSAKDAQKALRLHRARYGRNLERAKLGAEAMLLEVLVLDSLGRSSEATRRARELIRRYPDAPQAKAAVRWAD